LIFTGYFQGLLARRVMGQRGLEWKPGDVVTDPGLPLRKFQDFTGLMLMFL